jgi:hypothetical protein
MLHLSTTFSNAYTEELRGLRSCNEEIYEDHHHYPAEDIAKEELRDRINTNDLGTTTPRPHPLYNDIDRPVPVLPQNRHDILDYSDIDRSYYRAAIPVPPQYQRLMTPELSQAQHFISPELTQPRPFALPGATQANNPALNGITSFSPQGAHFIDLTQEPVDEPSEETFEEDLIMFSPVLSTQARVNDDPEDLMMLIDELDTEIADTQ